MSPNKQFEKLHPDVGSYISYSDLFPNVVPTFEYLIDELKKFDLTELVLVLTKINLLMSERKYSTNQLFQQYLYKYFLNNYHRERISSYLNEHGDSYFLFNRHQLLFLLKNAFLHCSSLPGINFQIPAVRERFGKCCLLANNFLNLSDIDEETLNSMPNERKREVLWKELLPGYELYVSTETSFEIGRMRLIFKRILPKLQSSQIFLDIDSIFQKHSGFSLDKFMFLIFGTFTLYHARRDEIVTNPNAIIIDVGAFIKHGKIEPERVTRLLDLISIPIEQFKKEILLSKDRDLNYGYLPFKKYPLAQISDGRYICFDFNFLIDKISNGIFWLIHDNLPKNDRDKFRAFWGEIFESYAIHIFEDSGLIKTKTFITKPYYNNSKDEIADGVLDFGEDLFLFEFKFTNLIHEAKYSSSIGDLVDEIKLKFEKDRNGEWKGYGQLANNINKLFSKDSKFHCKHINIKNIKRVYPVLIVYEHLLSAPFTNHILNRDFQKLVNSTSLKNNIEIKPLIVATIEDFEYSQFYLEKFHDLINERIDFDKELNFSFSDFIKHKFQKGNFSPTGLVVDEYKKFGKEVARAFFPKESFQEN